MVKVSVIVDNPKSWMNTYGRLFIEELKKLGYDAYFFNEHAAVPKGDVAVFLSCEKIISKETMKKNRHNLVVHESALPKGKGWSPVTWQVLEGQNEIPISIFEAAGKVDSGDVYYSGVITLEGHELIDEIRDKQAAETFKLVLIFLSAYPNVKGVPQKGEESFYGRRMPKDSELNPRESIVEQFNLLRVADNERYPAFFYYLGHRYILKIYKSEEYAKDTSSGGSS
jgi:methionyl-tRNA formyltransferase